MTVYLPIWHWHCTRTSSLFWCYAIMRLQFAHVRLLWLQRQVAKLSSGLFCCWSLLRNSTMAMNLQTITSSYGSRRFAACDQGSHWGFFSRRSAFSSRPGCLGLLTKNRVKSVFFWSDKITSNFTVFDDIKASLFYSVYMRTSDEKVRISDEAERVQSVSYPHMRSLSGLYI